MIKDRNIANDAYIFPNKIMGGVGVGSGAGEVFYCVIAASGPEGFLKSRVPSKNYYSSLTTAMAATKDMYSIILTGGDYSGNYTTPANSVARDVSVIAASSVGQIGGKTWMAPSTTSSPIFNVVARAWRFSGISFEAGANTSSMITLTGTNANYAQIDNNVTWTGKYGILNSGAHFVRVWDNQIANLNVASSIGIGSLAGIGGQMWDIRNNHFTDNYSHINFGSTRGLFGSRIEGNTFGGTPSVWIHPTVLLDNRNTSNTGGCAINGNYFGCTKTQYGDDSSTAFVRTQTRDHGMGNMCLDGMATAAISN